MVDVTDLVSDSLMDHAASLTNDNDINKMLQCQTSENSEYTIVYRLDLR